MTLIALPELDIFTKRLAADELLFELRTGSWRPLPPKLLKSNPPSSDPTLPRPSPAFTAPRYLVALLAEHPYLQNPPLEITMLESDYRDALYEIEGLGHGELWREFFQTRQRLYRTEQRSSPLKLGETVIVTQNRSTGKAHRDAMSCILKRAVMRPVREEL